MNLKKILLFLVGLTLFGFFVYIGYLFYLIYTEEPLDFDDGLSEIKAIVSQHGLVLPDYSQNIFKDDIKASKMMQFSCGAKDSSQINSAKKALLSYSEK
ncbi:MAG: hypothetical protein QXM75_04000, partial [Candidatus Diapherotrites archaeon]